MRRNQILFILLIQAYPQLILSAAYEQIDRLYQTFVTYIKYP
jgi:hypothetical protein